MTDIYTDFAPPCAAIAPLLVALFDNELPARDAGQARRHLETCAACRKTAEANAQTRAAAQTWTVEGADKRDLWASGVWARIAADTAETPSDAAPGFITAEQLAHALYISKRGGGIGGAPPLTEVLRKLGYATEREMDEARASAERIPFVDLAQHAPEAFACAVVPAEIAHRWGALPVKKDKTRLWVAFRNPRDGGAIDAVRLASGCLVQPMRANPSEFDTALARAYGDPPPRPPAADADAVAALSELRAELAALQAETARLRREVAHLKAQNAAPASRPQTRFDLYTPLQASPPPDASARVH